MNSLDGLARKAFRVLLRAYQLLISPLLHAWAGPGAGCRFEPSCSQYADESIRRFGGFRGSLLALRRLLRCHPFSRRGWFDPVPPSEVCGNPKR